MDSSPLPPDPAVLSVRIVSIDYYMAPPIPDVDFCYSPLHGREVMEVPVIRIYGSTPGGGGQKTCLHVHRNLGTEALGVLSWFASSQAAEDLNSNDELAKEAILTPLLSRRSYEEALEMAHSNYDNVSQQECQGILDSVECLAKYDEPKNENTVASHGLSGGSVSQADDSPNNDCITPEKFYPFQMNRSVKRKKPSTTNDRVGIRQDIKCKKNELLWGPLPFSTGHKEHDILHNLPKGTNE